MITVDITAGNGNIDYLLLEYIYLCIILKFYVKIIYLDFDYLAQKVVTWAFPESRWGRSQLAIELLSLVAVAKLGMVNHV